MQYQSGAVSPVESIQNGWNIIKDDYWTFFGMTLVAGIIVIIVSFVLNLINNGITLGISAVLGVAMKDSYETAKLSASLIPQLISGVISLFTNILLGVISGAFFCGIYMALERKVSSGVADFGDLFAGFQKLVPCLIVSTVLSIIQFILTVVFLVGGAVAGISVFGAGLLKQGQLDPSVFGKILPIILAAAAVFIVINIIISALLTFAYPLVANRNLPGLEALTLSVKGAFSNLGGLILMMILLGLMLFAGALVCGIGMLFVMPIYPAAIFAAYQSVFGRSEGFFRSEPPPPPIFNQPSY